MNSKLVFFFISANFMDCRKITWTKLSKSTQTDVFILKGSVYLTSSLIFARVIFKLPNTWC